MGRYKQGYFKPRNPEKYVGDIDNIVYRSGWELKTNMFLDGNPNILKWGSEPFPIPYMKPTTKKIHRYYVDYYVEYKKPNNEIVKELWEVKPNKETKSPRQSKNKTQKTKVYEQLTYEINKAKWKAAKAFCNKHNLGFRIITEKQLFFK